MTGPQGPPKTLAAFVERAADHGKLHAAITLQLLDGAIAKDSHLTAAELPPLPAGASPTLGRMDWEGHSIDMMEVAFTQNGMALTSVVAQVPLAPKSLQITLVGPAAEVASLRATARRVVASVIGLSNWDGPILVRLSPLQRVEKLITGAIPLAVICTIAVLIYRRLRTARAARRGLSADEPPLLP